MADENDIEVLIRSRTPIIVISSHEEDRARQLVSKIAMALFKPIFSWTVTEGLQRLDIDYPAQKLNSEPEAVLRHIKAAAQAGIYCLMDFHPYLQDPLHVRLLKDIALEHDRSNVTLVLISHDLKIPAELSHHSVSVELALPDRYELTRIVQNAANEWTRDNKGRRVKTDSRALEMLIGNLGGLTHRDAQRLARNAIYDDGAINHNDLQRVMEAKYRLLSRGGYLHFEYDTVRFSEIAGFGRLREWLQRRLPAMTGRDKVQDPPRGVLLLGVQGCGKSMVAKAIAGILATPLLRLDVGGLYNKYHGETERNLREALATAEAMEPCVLWIDEIEKGFSTNDMDGGTSQRVLGTVLTWLAEKKSRVFVVATANDIQKLPPELVRKGRFDEIFFVDLPDRDIRRNILKLHLKRRQLPIDQLDIDALADATEGFSGAEIEQVVVSARYRIQASGSGPSQSILEQEIADTRPLSVTMAERISALREWAASRTVPVD